MVALMPQGAFAQERKVQNRPYIDMRRWHYGFLFGLHVQDLEFTNNANVHAPEGAAEERWFTDVAAYTPGFSVGVLGELRLTEQLALRVVPTMYLLYSAIHVGMQTGFRFSAVLHFPPAGQAAPVPSAV